MKVSQVVIGVTLVLAGHGVVVTAATASDQGGSAVRLFHAGAPLGLFDVLMTPPLMARRPLPPIPPPPEGKKISR